MSSDQPVTEPTRKKPADHLGELQKLVVDYAKQETVDPLRSLGKYLGWGLGGAVAVSLGMFFVLLGTLRALQQIDWFNGPTQSQGWHGSWLVYLITLLVGVIAIAIAGLAAKRTETRRKGTSR